MFFALPPRRTINRFKVSGAFVVYLALVLASPVRAQINTVSFSTSDPGVSRAITNWGMGTVGGSDVIESGLIYMGTNQIGVIEIPFTLKDALTNGDISAASKAEIDANLTVADVAGSKPLAISSGTGDGVNSYYITGANRVDPTRWAANMVASKTYMTNRTIAWAQPFNEPDYGPWNQGNAQDLYNIISLLQNNASFNSTLLAGPTTISCDNAVGWYDAIKSLGPMGTTHCIGGSVNGYVSFIQTVLANNAVPFNPEMHNLGEAVIGAEYGLEGGIWWLRADLARGSFVNTCQGKQLGYADDWANWTAAAVYRGTNGAVQAFLGGSERMGVATTYRFFAKDRDVFYNGDGPRRDYTVTNPGNGEEVVNITWGADASPVINGRYIVVNHNSGKVMEVAGASASDGANIDQSTYTGGLNQQWDIIPYSSGGGDVSFYDMTAAHSGKAADVNAFSYADGANVQQWTNYPGLNQQWFFQYVSNGWFYIRNRWSGKYLDVYGSSTADGANIDQWTGNGGLNQQWRLIPAASAYDLVAPASPTNVTATANAVSVRLNWNANTEADLASYTVLRGTNSGGPYEIVARGLTNNAFTDKSANQPKTYYYVVKAVDRSLNTSSNSVEVSAAPGCGPTTVAHYTFDGNTSDSSGNANHPIVLDGSPALVAGKYGSALGLNGTSQDVLLPAGMMAGVTNFTIAAWVYWNGGNAWQRIFDFGNDTTQYMFLTPGSGSGTLRFAITTNGNGAEQIIETTPLASNQWIHVVVTCNGTTGCLYTNGVLAASGSISLNPAVFNPALNYLGKSQWPADPLFNGALDEVLVANYAMSAAQVAWLPFNSAPLPALVHRYSFNETSGNVVHDSVGGAVWNGALPNGGTFGGGQLTLSSAGSQYVNLPGGILSNYPAITIEAWATFPSQISYYTMFFGFGNTVSGVGNNYLFCAPQGGRIAITSTNYLGEQNAYSGIDFSFHTNLHVTAVFDPPASYLAIYTNGVLAGVNTAITTPMSAVSNVFSYIGRSLYSGDTWFDFSVDEFRIYNGVMQAADIAASQLAGPNVLLTTNVLLNPSISGGQLTLNWPVAGSGFTLASSPTLGSGAAWTPVSVTPNLVGGNYQLTITPTNGTLFFRLQR